MLERSAQGSQGGLGSINWRTHKLPLLVGAGVGLLLGIGLGMGLVATLSVGSKTQVLTIFMLSLRGAVTAIITTLFTYFLINRYLRMREREADEHILAYFAELMGMFEILSNIDKATEDEESYRHIVEWIEERKEGSGVLDASDLRTFLRSTIEERRSLKFTAGVFQDMRQTLSTITQMLSISSPKMAVASASSNIFYHFNAEVGSALFGLQYGERSFTQLEETLRYMDEGDELSVEEFEFIAEDIIEGIKLVYDQAKGLHEESQNYMEDFLARLPQDYLERYQKYADA